MENSLPIEPPQTFDGFHDSLTHHYAAPIFYEAVKREISFSKREQNLVGVIKFTLPADATSDQMMYFANELDLAVRQHDLISRLSERDFAVLIRLGSDTTAAFDALVARLRLVEKRPFKFCSALSDGTKDVANLLEELDNPQILISAHAI